MKIGVYTVVYSRLADFVANKVRSLVRSFAFTDHSFCSLILGKEVKNMVALASDVIIDKFRAKQC